MKNGILDNVFVVSVSIESGDLQHVRQCGRFNITSQAAV